MNLIKSIFIAFYFRHCKRWTAHQIVDAIKFHRALLPYSKLETKIYTVIATLVIIALLLDSTLFPGMLSHPNLPLSDSPGLLTFLCAPLFLIAGGLSFHGHRRNLRTDVTIKKQFIKEYAGMSDIHYSDETKSRLRKRFPALQKGRRKILNVHEQITSNPLSTLNSLALVGNDQFDNNERFNAISNTRQCVRHIEGQEVIITLFDYRYTYKKHSKNGTTTERGEDVCFLVKKSLVLNTLLRSYTNIKPTSTLSKKFHIQYGDGQKTEFFHQFKPSVELALMNEFGDIGEMTIDFSGKYILFSMSIDDYSKHSWNCSIHEPDEFLKVVNSGRSPGMFGRIERFLASYLRHNDDNFSENTSD